ncbi:Arginine exporter protein ArgO [Marinomonas spartinae]|uniref:LysE/ArgO family amino acid transporter n=1 Tax=Marinomonas spartinae TaxID=1792290 RepID=UPI000808EC5E|nr:LysE family transporter [Marinomonas spartinae]SBS28385.1 Arginine exporter protein ArgO [Marinomonas spartinae]
MAFLSGLITGGGLIVAVGAQNSFLLEQALKRHMAFPIALLFILSDALAIALGAFGIGALIHHQAGLLALFRWFGVLFLLWFAYQKWHSSFQEEHLIVQHITSRLSIWPLFLMALAVTWLNPHFYLDTMVLMGSLANQFPDSTLFFVIGGISASIIWFLSLSILGHLCANWLSSVRFWRWFNRANALLISIIAIKIATQSSF